MVGSIEASESDAVTANEDSELWNYTAESAYEPSSPVYDDGMVFFSEADHVEAVDAETGEQEWVTELFQGEFSPKPAVADGMVYVVGDDGNVTALDASTGKEEWVYEAGYQIRSPPRVANGLVYFGTDTWDRTVYAVDSETGEEEWTNDAPGDEIRPIEVVDGMVYAGSADGYLYALNQEDDIWWREEWSFEADDWVISLIDIVDDTIYTTSGDFVYAIDRNSGDEEWAAEVEGGAGQVVHDDGRLYFLSDGDVVALDIETQDELWRVDIDRPSAVEPDGDSVYVGSEGNESVHQLDAESGGELSTFDADGQVREKPTSANDVLYAMTRDGVLHAIDIDTGDDEARVPKLEIDDFDDEFPDATAGEEYGEVAITVTETAGVETENLEVQLTLVSYETEQTVYESVIDDRELQEESNDFRFDVGAIDDPGTYGAYVTVRDDATDDVWESTTFELEPITDEPAGTIELEDPIHEDQEAFEVTYTFENTTDDDAVVQVGKTEPEVIRHVEEDGSFHVDVDDLGGIQTGDDINAQIWDELPEGDGVSTVEIEEDLIRLEPLDWDRVVVEGDVEVIDECTTIRSPGSYVLGNDVSTDQTGNGNACLEITASDVTLDGQGNSVVGGDPIEWRGGNYGIDVSHATNVEITDVDVRGWDELGTSIMVRDTTDVTLSNVVAENNTFGPRTDDVDGFTLRDSRVQWNERAGVQILDSDDATLRDVQAIENAQASGWAGVYVRGESTGITLHNVTAERSQDGGHGVRVTADNSDVTITDSVAAENDAAGFLIETSEVSMIDNTADGNEWDLRAEADGPVIVDRLDIGESVEPETTLSVQGENAKLRANATPPDNPDAVSIGRYVETNATDDDSSLDVRVRYEDDDLGGVDEGTLRIWRFDGDDWHPIERSEVDPETNVVAATLSEGATVGVFGDETDEPTSPSPSPPPAPSEPAVFELDIDENESQLTVAEGERIVLVVEVTNAGDRRGTQALTAGVTDTRDSERVSLRSGQSTTVELAFTAELDDTGEHAFVASEDDEVSVPITVVEPGPANFSVAIDENASTLDVFEGENVTLVTEVTNVGSESGTQNLTAGVGDARSVEPLTLDGGESTVANLSFAPELDDDGASAVVESSNDSDSVPITVSPLEPANFTVAIDANASSLDVLEGEPVTVVASVTNVGDEAGTQRIELIAEESVLDSDVVELDENASTEIEFEWNTAAVDAGDYDLTVRTQNASDSETATIHHREPVRSVSKTALSPGETTTVSVSVAFEEATNFTIVEAFDSFEEVELVDDDGASFSGVTDSNDELFATFTDRERATVVFDVTVPDDASAGTHRFGGFVEESEERSTTVGDDAVEIPLGEEPYATRSIGNSLIAPGGTTTVTLSVGFDEPTTFTVVDAMDAFEAVEIVDDDGADFSGTTDANDELFATYTDRDEVSLAVEVTVGENGDGDSYTFDGFVDVEGSERSIDGEDELSVALVPDGTEILHVERAEIVTDDETGSSSVEFSEASSVSSVEFGASAAGHTSVADLDGVPSDVDPLNGSVVSITQLSVPDSVTDTNATIRKQLSVEEIEDAGIDVETLQINRYSDGEWQPLETEVVDQTNGSVVLETETPGFSYFAVSDGGQPDEAISPWLLVVTFVAVVGLLAGAGYLARVRTG